MIKKLLIPILFVTIFAVCETVSANAQTNLTGKYYYDTKIDNGRNNFRYLFDLRNKNVAVYTNEQEGAETQRRSGLWSWNKKNGTITVTLQPVKNPTQGQEVKLTFVFKIVGNKLKLIKDLPYNMDAGAVYQKL